MITFHLINQTSADSVLRDADLAHYASALQGWFDVDVKDGLNFCKGQYRFNATRRGVAPPAPGPQDWPVLITDRIAVQGALGYHDMDPRTGYAASYIAALTTVEDQRSLTEVIGHECVEAAWDPNTVRAAGPFMAGARYLFVLQEACDPVNGQPYVSSGIKVPNYVLPSYWLPGAKGPYDRLGKLPGPLTVDPSGGYLPIYYATGIASGQLGQSKEVDPDDRPAPAGGNQPPSPASPDHGTLSIHRPLWPARVIKRI